MSYIGNSMFVPHRRVHPLPRTVTVASRNSTRASRSAATSSSSFDPMSDDLVDFVLKVVVEINEDCERSHRAVTAEMKHALKPPRLLDRFIKRRLSKAVTTEFEELMERNKDILCPRYWDEEYTPLVHTLERMYGAEHMARVVTHIDEYVSRLGQKQNKVEEHFRLKTGRNRQYAWIKAWAIAYDEERPRAMREGLRRVSRAKKAAETVLVINPSDITGYTPLHIVSLLQENRTRTPRRSSQQDMLLLQAQVGVPPRVHAGGRRVLKPRKTNTLKTKRPRAHPRRT